MMQRRVGRAGRRKPAGWVWGGLLSAVGLLVGGLSAAPHWSYHEPGTGPDQWAGLDPAWSVAGTGHQQSPIDIPSGEAKSDGALAPLKFDYRPVTAGATVVNNGHTVQVNFPAGQTLDFNGTQYNLLQFHFHTPSENTIDGQHQPLCAHLVHRNAEGRLLVVGVLYRNGQANKLIDQVFEAVEHGGGHGGHGTEPTAVKFAVDPTAMLPTGRAYYSFAGSLTTPPCSEGVTWVVMKEAAECDPAIAGTMLGLFGGTNNRPVQPRHNRPIQQCD